MCFRGIAGQNYYSEFRFDKNRAGKMPALPATVARFTRLFSHKKSAASNRCGGIVLLYMIVEHFKDNDPVPVYRRFRDRGRLLPDGLKYISSWVDQNLERCFQLMETDDRRLLDEWIAKWSDIAEFEVHSVLSSSEAVEKVSPRL